MQKILSFNTIFDGLEIILQNGDEVVLSKKISYKKQSEILVSSLEEVLHGNCLDYGDVDIFSTIIGPGNFTGIKTSLAVLKALKISTHKKIITTDVFEIISHNVDDYAIIILDVGTVKYYIKDDNEYCVIYKKEVEDFLNVNGTKKILTNDMNIIGMNVEYSKYTIEKWAELIEFKAKNHIFTDEIIPLYIEEAAITKRKS